MRHGQCVLRGRTQSWPALYPPDPGSLRRRAASRAEFAQIMAELALNYPTVQTIHLVVDNLNIHCRKSLTDHYGEIPRTNLWNQFTVHYTPKHGSWLNQAEIEIGLF